MKGIYFATRARARELKNQNFSVCHITFITSLNHQILRTADYYQGFTQMSHVII